MIPMLKGIDHIHIYVTDKAKAVDWYSRVLGFKVYDPLKLWDSKTGPLTLSDAADTIHLALFEKDNYERLSAVAFATSGEGFIQWKQWLEQLGIDLRIADHQVAWSLYFDDPFGHSHEITTSEYQLVSEQLVRI